MRYLLLGVIIGVSLMPGLAEARYDNRDRTKPTLQPVHIQSNAANPAVARTGDKVTITFTASEAVTPIVLVETRTLFVRATNSGGNTWEASYTVDSRDRAGRVDYLLSVVDRAGNSYTCASRRILIIPACPNDGSIVTVDRSIVPPPTPDTQPPAIAPTANIVAAATDANGAIVSYATPAATDNVDATVVVSCAPASGSVFAIGDTAVACSATDAASNTGNSTFVVTVSPLPPPPDTTAPVLTLPAPISQQAPNSAGATITYSATALDETDGVVSVSCTPASGSLFPVGVTMVNCSASDIAGNSASDAFTITITPHVPQPVTILSQPIQTTFCNPWNNCYTGGSSQSIIPLGQINSPATIKSVTFARDPSFGELSRGYLWFVYLKCYQDAGYALPCVDWPTMGKVADISTDLKYWTADFSSSATFRPEYYYQLVINDNGYQFGAYGSPTQPYWVLTGLQ